VTVFGLLNTKSILYELSFFRALDSNLQIVVGHTVLFLKNTLIYEIDATLPKLSKVSPSKR